MGGSALLLGAVARTGLLTVLHAGGVEGPADDLVADTGEVAYPAGTQQHDRVLLEVVPDAGDVRRNLDARGEPHTRHLAQRRIRLLRGDRLNTGADAPPLGRTLQRRSLRLRLRPLAAAAHELLDGRHGLPVCTLSICQRTRRAAIHAPGAPMTTPLGLVPLGASGDTEAGPRARLPGRLSGQGVSSPPETPLEACSDAYPPAGHAREEATSASCGMSTQAQWRA